MENSERKEHWEKIYQTKDLKDVSWFQPTPETSLGFLKQFNIARDAKIIDVGGGDGFFVDHLLDLGYINITVLDISEAAIDKVKKRLGERANSVKWIVQDAAHFSPEEKYDFWHDRAAFHFLTDENEIENYIKTVEENLNDNGVLVLGTFSEQGPKKCSGIEIKQYSENSMHERLQKYFRKIKCIKVDHKTPFGTVQEFVFCSFRKLKSDK